MADYDWFHHRAGANTDARKRHEELRKQQEEVQAAFNEKRADAPFAEREDEHPFPWSEDALCKSEPDVVATLDVPCDECEDERADSCGVCWSCSLPDAGPDPVTRPAHYTHSRIEVWDAIDAWGLGYRLGNVVKYVARADRKGDPIQDIRKALAYLKRELEVRERGDLLYDLAGMTSKTLPPPVEFR